MILMSMCLLLLMICIHIGITNPLDSFVYHFLDTTIQNYGLIIYLEVISVVFAPINCLFMILVILSVLYFYNPFKFWWYGWWSFSVLLIGTLFKYIIQRTRPRSEERRVGKEWRSQRERNKYGEKRRD